MLNFEVLFYYILVYLPFVLLFFIVILLRDNFFELKNTQFNLGIERVVFEIKTPKEITKTPLAMELILAAMHNTSGESTWFDRTFLGKRRVHMSLEIVSISGQVKFYIWAPKSFTKVIESAFYSQYPSVQLIEVLDYTKFYGFDPEKQGMFGVEYKLAKPDPYPIKTYKEFGLDKPGLKPEEIVDPVSYILEVLGNIGEGENMWLQIVIRAQKKDSGKGWNSFLDIFKKRKFKAEADWTKEAEEIIAKLQNVKNPEEEGVKRLDIDSEKKIIDAIAENISKPSFWTGIRAMYFSDGDKFNPNNISAMTNIFNMVKSETLNNLNAGGFTTSFDYPWNDYKDIRLNKVKKEFFADYKRRRYYRYSKKINPHFFLPFLNQMQKYNDFIMSTEELATIYHLPSTVVSAPTFDRAESKRGAAPSNLPF